jgi:hypothetical protein
MVQSGIGAVLDNGDPFFQVAGNTVEIVYFQDLSTPASVVTNVGRGAGTPGNLAIDFLNDPQWNNSAGIFSGTFTNLTPAFSPTPGPSPEMTDANLLSAATPPFSFAAPASITTIVRSNLPGDDTWDNTSGSGLWSDAANWADNTEPTAAGVVTFPAGFPNADTTITLSANEAAKGLILSDNYTLSGGFLTLPAAATISVAPAKTATITSTLNLSTLTKSGNGTLSLTNVRADALTLTAGTVKVIPGGGNAGTSRLGDLTISPGAKFDLTDHGLVLQSSNPPTDLNDLRAQLLSGRGSSGGVAGGQWNGPTGLTSSTAAQAFLDNNKETLAIGYALNGELLTAYTTFLGQPVADSDLLIRLTRNADANLDGVVNNNDITILAGFYRPGTLGRHWHNADFNYDGEVNNNDITILAGFYAPNAPPLTLSSSSLSPVPEPSLSVLFLPFVAAFFRRRGPSFLHQ